MNTNVDQIIKATKAILSESKIRYAQVAHALGMSESGVKKMFTSEDISLSKLLSILDILDITLEDVLRKSLEFRPIEKLKKQQIDAFLEEPKLFFFFMKLREFKYKPALLKKEYSLTKLEMESYLSKLVKIDIIERDSKEVTSYLQGVSINIDKSLTELQLHYFENNFMSLLKKKRQKNFKGIYAHGSLNLSEQNLASFRLDYFNLLNKYYDLEEKNEDNTEHAYLFACVEAKGQEIYPLK
ncbi:helix-turn-helix transcriptional regulator [Halobacteriovorax sp. XZX-3]|uniref:helix-turn-helix domain-containing protein n=1 Tax=unclassified Halobacteriovorax TaxID=2639665 RepID=UPI00371C8F3E